MTSTQIKGLSAAILMVLLIAPLKANKTSVTITAPDKVKKGSEITISLEVTHSGNNFMHYTNWVYLKVNGVEKQKWAFSSFNRPENEKFTRTVTMKADEKLDLEAEGNCNIHGSMGVTKASVQAQ